jgi:hypothetical protein
MGKIIWQLNREYKKFIKRSNNFTLFTIAFCKELVVIIRPELETYIFMIIRDSDLL